MIRIKQGVDLRGLSPQMALAAAVARDVYEEARCNCVVTSGCDGTHMEGSKHYTGEALDFRTLGIAKHFVAQIAAGVRAALGAQFDVVLEADHLHVEFDPDG